jgi:hypothetical protein
MWNLGRFLRVAAAAMALCALSACTVTLISHYDEETDKGVAQLHSEIAAHLAKLEQLAAGPGGAPVTPACRFDNFKDTYAQFLAKAHVLTVRNEIREKNQLTTAQLGLLEQSLGDAGLMSVHRDADGQCMTLGTVQATRAMLDQHFRAVLKLELAKKLYRAGEKS